MSIPNILNPLSTSSPLNPVGGLIATGINQGEKALIRLLQNPRAIGGRTLDCVLFERHSDTMTITSHPVQYGAQISDHAYMNPKSVMLKIVDTGGLKFGGSGVSFTTIKDLYQIFLDMQSSRGMLSVLTGKRIYSDMLIEAIEEETDRETENMLGVTLYCKQVITAYTSVQKVVSLDKPVSNGVQKVFDDVKQSASIAAQKIPALKGLL